MDTGMTRKIDDLGRVVIPSEMRSHFHIGKGDQLYISVEGNNILLRKLTSTCAFCGSTEKDSVIAFRQKAICKNCISDLPSQGRT